MGVQFWASMLTDMPPPAAAWQITAGSAVYQGRGGGQEPPEQTRPLFTACGDVGPEPELHGEINTEKKNMCIYLFCSAELKEPSCVKRKGHHVVVRRGKSPGDVPEPLFE